MHNGPHYDYKKLTERLGRKLSKAGGTLEDLVET